MTNPPIGGLLAQLEMEPPDSQGEMARYAERGFAFCCRISGLGWEFRQLAEFLSGVTNIGVRLEWH